MTVDTAAIRGTIWLAVAAWVAAEWRRTAPAASSTSGRTAWTLGASAALVHVVLAFHVHHGWSHAAAMAETARQTAALTGWPWGGGVYFNYVFVLLWSADAGWWWLEPASFHRRARWIGAALRAFLWFLFLNGAFVFVRGPARWLGLLAAAAVVVAWYRGRGAGAT